MKLRAFYILLAAGFGVISTGCGSTEVHQIFLRHPSMNPHRDIEIYVTGAPPKRAYYDVAILQAIGHGDQADVEDVTHAIANRAARLGCDAVVRLHVELGATRAHASGVCVNWAEGSVAAPTTPTAVPAPAPLPPPNAPSQTPPPTTPPSAPDDGTSGTSI